MEAVELQGFWIDTVRVAYVEPEEEEGVIIPADPEPKVQMVRYSVLATDGEDALRRFFEEEAGVISEETEPTDLIVVGMSVAGPPGVR